MLDIKIKQISSLIKVRSLEDFKETDVYYEELCKGEHFAFQVAVYCDANVKVDCVIESPLKECIKAYTVHDAIVDNVAPKHADDDFITKQPCSMPDILLPLEEQKNTLHLNGMTCIWIDVNIPEDCETGKYEIKTVFTNSNDQYSEEFRISETMKIVVKDAVLPKQKLITTQWFHSDCIASVHNVEIFSERHWELIDSYMETASEIGLNMILTPVFSLCLDTEYGTERPNAQLVDISRDNGEYTFDFTRLKRWIGLCKKHNFEYVEISHLFSQWGAKCTPNIRGKENGKEILMFGWHTSSRDEEYAKMLRIFLPQLIEVLREEGVKEKTYFHISDEPSDSSFENYEYASKLIRPYIDDCKIFETCSTFSMVKKNLMDIPVVATNHIHKFLEEGYKNLFAYYCGSQLQKVSNRLITMPAYRNRIIGLQLYKYDIKGFLHWGYNFYYNGDSNYAINPYVTTTANKHFTAGCSFSVYPGKDGAVLSTRALVFKDALQDVRLCKLLESYIGKEKVVELIEQEAGMEITFENYPRNNDFLLKLTAKLKRCIEERGIK